MRTPNMTSGYSDREREFLDALEADTGRTLTQWMEVIRAQGLTERNDIIDWLRRQGFRFSRASWLERVHHNGGKPIYADRPAGATTKRTPRPAARQHAPVGTPRPSTTGVLGSSVLPPPTPLKPAAPVAASPQPARPAGDAYASAAANAVPVTFSNPLNPEITALTAKAKAYRPLADFLLREIAKTVPAATFAVRGQHIVIACPAEFATLAVSSRDLRLAIGQAGTVTLTDARQVDAALLARINAAATTAS